MFFSLISVLFNILITPLALVYIYLLYENLKSVKGEISIDPAKRQAIWYLVIGFAGWLFMFLIWGILFSFLLTLLMGMFVGQALTGLDNPKLNLPTEALPFAPQAVTPAGLSAEQKKQLETQMETMKKLQDQLTKFKATLPDETLDQ